MDTPEECWNSCKTNKLASVLVKPTNTYAHDDDNAGLETRKYSGNSPTVIPSLSTSELCFGALTEADQATSRPFCNHQHSDANSCPLCNHLHCSDNSCPFYNHQTIDGNGCSFPDRHIIENTLMKGKYLNENKPGNYQGESRMTDTFSDNALIEDASDSSCRNAIEANSAPLNANTSTTVHAGSELDIDAQQQDPSNLIELSRQSVFVDPVTGQQFLVVYGSSSDQESSDLIGSEIESPSCFIRSHRSSESTDDLDIKNDVFDGSPSSVNLSPKEHAYEKRVFSNCERDDMCRERNTGTVPPLDRTNICSYSQDVITDVQSHDVRAVQIQQVYHRAQSIPGIVPLHARSIPGNFRDHQPFSATVFEHMNPFAGFTKVEQTSQCQDEHLDVKMLSKSQPELFSFKMKPEITSTETNDHTRDHGILVDHLTAPDTHAHNSGHKNESGHPTTPTYFRRPTGLSDNRQISPQLFSRDSFTAESSIKNQTQNVQSGLRIQCVVCRTPFKRTASLQESVSIRSFTDKFQKTITQTDTPSHPRVYAKSLSTGATQHRADRETLNTFTPANQTDGPLLTKTSNQCETCAVDRDPQFLNPQKRFDNFHEGRSCDYETKSSSCDEEKQETSQRESTHPDRYGLDDRRTTSSGQREDNSSFKENQMAKSTDLPTVPTPARGNMAQWKKSPRQTMGEQEVPTANVSVHRFSPSFNLNKRNRARRRRFTDRLWSLGPLLRSVSQKNYLAYLCCAQDNLLSFGLSFHRMLETWGMHIFIPERDLELSGSKYENIAKCVKESCNGKVIVVLSKSYPDSDECLFLTNFAKTLDPDSKRKNIIPVLIDKDVQIPNVLQGVSLIKYNYLYRQGWLKDKMIRAIAA